MYDPTAGAAINAAADPTVPRRSLTFEHRWAASTSEQLERTRLIEQARHTDAAERLRRCCPSAVPLLEQLSWRALTRLAANQPVDPNRPRQLAQPRRARADRAAPPRHHRPRQHQVDDGGCAASDRRPGARRPRGRAGLDPPRRPAGAAPRSPAARPRPAADRPRRPGHLRLPRRSAPGTRRPARRRGRTGRRPLTLVARPSRRLRGR